MFTRLLVLLMVVGGILGASSGADAQDCDSMWALQFAQDNGLGDCDTTPFTSVGHDCDGLTANGCAAHVYNNPASLLADRSPTNTGPFYVTFTPDCEDGTNNCPGQELRCVDGTHPIYYVDKAKDPSTGADIESPNWLFFFQGGGSCGFTSGLESGGVSCWEAYQSDGEHSETTSDNHKVHKAMGGILSDDTRNAYYFRTWNRVKIHKCGYDRFTGTLTRGDTVNLPYEDVDPITGGKPTNTTGDTFELHFHGARLIKAVMQDLKDGKHIESENCSAEDPCDLLPPLKDAARIVLAGHSGGAEGLISNLDQIKADLESDILVNGGADTDIRGVIDERFWPSLDNESSFEAGQTDPDCDGLYQTCNDYAGDLPPGEGASSTFSKTVYKKQGFTHRQNDYLGMQPDASCLAAGTGHPVAQWHCHDSSHVLFNHLETPFFGRQALADAKQAGKAPNFADDPAYDWDATDFTDRVHAQAIDYMTRSNVDACESSYYNRPIAVYMPMEDEHNGITDNDESPTDHHQFFDTLMCKVDPVLGTVARSYMSTLYAWLYDMDLQLWLLDGYDGWYDCSP